MADYKTSWYSTFASLVTAVTDAATADVDAILATGGASTTGSETWETAELNGVIGTGTTTGPRKYTVTLNSHADWDATTATARYRDIEGVLHEESLSIPNGGNTTLTTKGWGVTFVSLSIPAQSGTNGTFTIGVAADTVVNVYLDTTLNGGHQLQADGTIPSTWVLHYAGGMINARDHQLTIGCRVAHMPPDVQWLNITQANGEIVASTRGVWYANWFPGSDLGAQWNRMIRAYTRAAGTRIRSGYTFCVAAGEYTTATAFDVTGLRGANTSIDLSGAEITFTCADKICIDMTGSTTIRVKSLGVIVGDEDDIPAFGLVCARDNRDALASSGKHVFESGAIGGYFTKYAHWNCSAEENRYEDVLRFANFNEDGLGCFCLDDMNHGAANGGSANFPADATSEFSGVNTASTGALNGPCYPGNGDNRGQVVKWSTVASFTGTSVTLTTGGMTNNEHVGKTVQVGVGANARFKTITANTTTTISWSGSIVPDASNGEDVAVRTGSGTSSSGLYAGSIRLENYGSQGSFINRGFDRAVLMSPYIEQAENEDASSCVFDTSYKAITQCHVLLAYFHGAGETSPGWCVRIRGLANRALTSSSVTVRKIASNNDNDATGSESTPGGMVVESPFRDLFDCHFELLSRRIECHADVVWKGCSIKGVGYFVDADAIAEQPITLGASFTGTIDIANANKITMPETFRGMVKTTAGVLRLDLDGKENVPALTIQDAELTNGFLGLRVGNRTIFVRTTES